MQQSGGHFSSLKTYEWDTISAVSLVKYCGSGSGHCSLNVLVIPVCS